MVDQQLAGRILGKFGASQWTRIISLSTHRKNKLPCKTSSVDWMVTAPKLGLEVEQIMSNLGLYFTLPAVIQKMKTRTPIQYLHLETLFSVRAVTDVRLQLDKQSTISQSPQSEPDSTQQLQNKGENNEDSSLPAKSGRAVITYFTSALFQRSPRGRQNSVSCSYEHANIWMVQHVCLLCVWVAYHGVAQVAFRWSWQVWKLLQSKAKFLLLLCDCLP